MSKESIEIVREQFEATNRREFAWFRTFGTEVTFDITRIRGGGDAVAGEIGGRAKGRSSGIEVKAVLYVYRLERGKIKRLQFYESWSQALAAAGLSE